MEYIGTVGIYSIHLSMFDSHMVLNISWAAKNIVVTMKVAINRSLLQHAMLKTNRSLHSGVIVSWNQSDDSVGDFYFSDRSINWC